ncbi:N-acetyltransferase family protein [Neobacillus pocheonensis]|uniref:GNAT family N-acetyltransferase n=1 Tax=Neobacillus pocheonensis TaxID=363869 RepID=UPI003D2E1562
MNYELNIEVLEDIEASIEELSKLLVKVVDDGAAVGFLPPMKQSFAREYWNSVLAPGVILFVAKINKHIVGSVQLHLCAKENGLHRADIAKLITDPNFRRRGLGRALMQKAEERAIQEGRSLLVLDTREGDPSNLLYQSLGFIEAGRIPYFAKSANGELHTTVLYYKSL